MVMNRDEGQKCEVYVDGVRLEHVSECKYLGWENQVQTGQTVVGRYHVNC